MSKVDQAKGKKEVHTSGTKGHTSKPPPPKRPNTEMCETSAEEITIISHTLDGLTVEMKEVRECLTTLLKKDDIETLIKNSVKEILDDFNKNLEFTVNQKVEEKNKGLNKRLDNLEKEKELLKKEILTQKTTIETIKGKIETDNTQSKRAEQMANYNEQYSRKTTSNL